MASTPRFFGFYAKPPFPWFWVLLPFVLVVFGYLAASHWRQAQNPDDKLLPTVAQMASAVNRMAFTEDPRSGGYLMVRDTLASLKRLGMGVSLAAVVGLLLGLNMGLFTGVKTLLATFITVFSMVPPLAVLPILFISFGVEELAKVMLIFIGIFPMITRDIYLATLRIPDEQLTKALTLGASQLAVAYRIVLPQIMPRLLDAVRLALGAAWLFLIAAEAIAATDGLGYRIFLVRRYLAMDIIIPYVLWVTCLGFGFDWMLRLWLAKRYPWYLVSNH
ncbi:MAG: ABC transporter permease subunit [Pseudomonadota bacterium]